jgi:hypothetical protein
LDLFHDQALPLERITGTPVHGMLFAAWRYALGRYFGSKRRLNRHIILILTTWLNPIFFHTLVNTLPAAWGFPKIIHFLGYGLFPLLFWMFWRWEKLLRKVEGKLPMMLIYSNKPLVRYWDRGLVLLSLFIGGNAILELLILVRLEYWFKPDIFRFILEKILLIICLGVLAWLMYFHLRNLARRRSFLKLAKY